MNNASRQNTESNKSRYFLIISIIFFLLGMSMVFFWYGNKASGILMIALPAISLLISTCCYMVNRNHDVNAVMTQIDPAFLDLDNETNLRHPHNFNDRPPSYRMTWRRSFFKRFKNRTDHSHHQTEMEDIEIPPSPTSGPVDEQQRRLSEGREDVHMTDLASSAQEIEQNRQSFDEGKENGDKNYTIGKARSEEALRKQDSLPTYDEALEIIRSRSDLTQE